MASSNVQYYEKQRELQSTIADCQQERMDLERQLQIALKADQTSAKLKASRLSTYWKKICEDERKAKQRNEMLVREFERIDTHMSELNSRTQRLAQMKKQYENYISQTYPKWNELMQGSQHQTELSTDQTRQTGSVHSQNPQTHDGTGKLSSRSQSVTETNVGRNSNNKGRSAETIEVVHTQQPVKEQHTQQQDQGQQHQWQKLKTSSNNMSMQPDAGEDEEEVSDFGSDSELPMGQSLVNTQIRVDTQPNSGKTSSSSKINGSTRLELSIDGLINLLQLVEVKMVNTFSHEEFYRTLSLPDTAEKNDIIRKANSNGDLRNVDASRITGVILDQITNIVLNLPEKCLLPENLLQNVSSLTVPVLSNPTAVGLFGPILYSFVSMCLQHLSPEAQVIWDALYAHFVKLVQCDVMKPQELSIVFAPCLVGHGGSLDKAQKFIVQLLEGRTDISKKITVFHNTIKTTSPRQTMESSGSFVEDGKVPPLKFGSLLDKPGSDDESSYINSSLPHDPVPLNETEAYKSMVSVSGIEHPHRQMSVRDDTDDDVEKQIASALVRNSVTQMPAQKRIVKVDDPSETSSQTLQTSPHVYVPTAMEPRQTINSSRVPLSKFQGVKISSDLDTDTEVDAGIFGSSRRPEDNSDFDFYD